MPAQFNMTMAALAAAGPAGGTAAATGPGPSEAVLLAQIVVLIFVGRMLGEAMHRFGQPVIMGQLIAGVLLGPSVLGAWLPAWEHALFPAAPEQKAMLNAVSQLGILLILLLTGMDTDLESVRRSRRAALTVSVTGILLPFACGVLLGQLMPAQLLPDPGKRFVTALFLGTALSISSVKIVALLVKDLGFLRRRVGQVIVASAIIDDTLGWVIMSVVFGLALRGRIDAAGVSRNLLGTAAFLAVSFTFGRRIVFRLIRWSNDRFESELPVIAMILIITGAMALLTDAIGVHTVLGAFIAGVLIGQSPILTTHIQTELRGLIVALFMPVFFGMAGLSADLHALANPMLIALTAALIAIASIGKFSGAVIGGRAGGLTLRESVAVGCGMNARGSTEIIIASFGLALGALNRDLFTVIVIMAVLTTLAMPPMLRWAFARLPDDPGERARIEREDAEAQGFISNIERVLLTADASRSGLLASHLVGVLAGVRGLPGTAVHLEHPSANGARHAQRTENVLNRAAEAGGNAASAASDEPPSEQSVDVDVRVAAAAHSEATIVSEAKKGYGMLVIGREPTSDGRQFDADIARSATSFGGPVAIVSARGRHRRGSLDAPLHLLVPITGTSVSRRAAELAIALAQGSRGHLTVLYIAADAGAGNDPGRGQRRATPDDSELGRAAIEEIAALGKLYDVRVQGLVRRRESARRAILREAGAGGFDLLVMGVSPRSGEQLAFGEVAADLLAESPCSLTFVTSEPVAAGPARAAGA